MARQRLYNGAAGKRVRGGRAEEAERRESADGSRKGGGGDQVELRGAVLKGGGD